MHSSLWYGFLLHIFNLFWSLHSFPSIWKTSFIIPIYKIEKSLDSPASFRPISLTSCVSKLFERIILWRLSSFWNLTPCQANLCLGRFTLDQILYLYQSTSNWFSPRLAHQRFLLLSTCLRLSTLSSTPPFFIHLFRLSSFLALLVGLNLFFLTGVLAWFFKTTKVAPFETVKVFARIRLWPCSLLSFHQ